MSDDNRQSVENKSIKKWLLTGAAIVLVFLIFYFTSTDAPPLTSDFANTESLNPSTTNIFYNWWALLLTLTGIIFLPLWYLAATKKINRIYKKLSKGYKSLKSQIKSPEEEKDLAINLAVVVALIIFFIGLSYNCCGLLPPLSTQLFKRLSNPDELLNIRNILIGIAGVITLIFAGWRTYIVDQQKEDQVRRTEIESSRRLSERFDGAVAALSKKLDESSFPSHLGGISSLRDLATDSPEHTQRCLDIICSCNQWMEGYIIEFIRTRKRNPYDSWLLKEDRRIVKEDEESKITLLHEKRSQKALIAISHILRDISINNPVQLSKLDFHNKMLCGISLSDIKLDNINFEKAYLVAASLRRVSLKLAVLRRVNLQGASLWDVNLQSASFINSRLESASLRRVNLQDASLKWVYLTRASLRWVSLIGASLRWVDLAGASLQRANLQEAYLGGCNLGGAYLKDADLEKIQLINIQFQGATIVNVNLSYAIFLDCNLYGATLQDIKSKSIIFNDIVDIGYLKDKEERIKFLDYACRDMKPQIIKLFTQRMEDAWQAIENNQEPDGLEAMRESSIITKDNQGMYDISKNDLVNLQERWQNLVNDKGKKFLLDMRNALLSLNQPSPIYPGKITEILYKDISIDKNTSLVKKLLKLIAKLIEGNKKTEQ